MNLAPSIANEHQARLDWIIEQLEGGIYDPEELVAVARGNMCPRCEARRGDNDHCVVDGSPHPWL